MDKIRNFVAQSIPSEECARSDVEGTLIGLLDFSDLDDPEKFSYIEKIRSHFLLSCEVSEHALYNVLRNDTLTPKTAEYVILSFAYRVFGDTITCKYGKAYRRYFESKQFEEMVYDMSCGHSIIEYFSDVVDAIENVSHTSQDDLREQIDRASKDIDIFFKLIKLDTDDNVYYEARRLWYYAEKRKFAMIEVIANICVEKYKALQSFMGEFQGTLFSRAKQEISNLILDASEEAKLAYGNFMIAVVSTADGILNCIIENSYTIAINGITLATMGTIGKLFECLNKISNTKNRCAYAILMIYAVAGELCMIMHLGQEYQLPTKLEHYVEGLYSILVLLGREPAIDPGEAEDIRDGVLRSTAALFKYIHWICLDASSFDQVVGKVAIVYKCVINDAHLSMPNPKNVVSKLKT